MRSSITQRLPRLCFHLDLSYCCLLSSLLPVPQTAELLPCHRAFVLRFPCPCFVMAQALAWLVPRGFSRQVYFLSPYQFTSIVSPSGCPSQQLSQSIAVFICRLLCFCPLGRKLARAEMTSVFLSQGVPSTYYNVKHVIRTQEYGNERVNKWMDQCLNT